MKSIKVLIFSLALLCVQAEPKFPVQKEEEKSSKSMRFYFHLNEKELNERMEYFSKSLGVKCQYCHLEDRKINLSKTITSPAQRKILQRKEITRKMIEMVEKLNSKKRKKRKAFGKEKELMDCNFCHQGKANPLL